MNRFPRRRGFLLLFFYVFVASVVVFVVVSSISSSSLLFVRSHAVSVVGSGHVFVTVRPIQALLVFGIVQIVGTVAILAVAVFIVASNWVDFFLHILLHNFVVVIVVGGAYRQQLTFHQVQDMLNHVHKK